MSEQPRERKNRFQISREVQEEFVNGIAETMLSLAEKAGDWQQGWTSDTPVGMPFCPVTGREYSGANLVRLLLTTIVRGYADDRWMTFNQLQSFQNAHPELQMNIRKGERSLEIPDQGRTPAHRGNEGPGAGRSRRSAQNAFLSFHGLQCRPD